MGPLKLISFQALYGRVTCIGGRYQGYRSRVDAGYASGAAACCISVHWHLPGRIVHITT